MIYYQVSRGMYEYSYDVIYAVFLHVLSITQMFYLHFIFMLIRCSWNIHWLITLSTSPLHTFVFKGGQDWSSRAWSFITLLVTIIVLYTFINLLLTISIKYMIQAVCFWGFFFPYFHDTLLWFLLVWNLWNTSSLRGWRYWWD